MDYKEKLEEAKKLYETANADQKYVLESLFPELAESEDEKVRKWIINDIRYNMDNETLENSEYKKQAQKALAWLEKQGEIDEELIARKFLVNKGYPIDGNGTFPTYEDMFAIIKKGLEKQDKNDSNKMPIVWKHWKDGICGNGEGKPIYLIKDGDTYSISPVLGYECDYIELAELYKLISAKDTLKFKVGDWGEEDEQIYNRLCGIIHNVAFASYDVDETGKECGEYAKITEWLKSLIPQNRWKPSDEQIDVLDKVIRNPYLSTAEYNGLIALKEQLKAL